MSIENKPMYIIVSLIAVLVVSGCIQQKTTEYHMTDNYFGKGVDCASIDGQMICDSGLDGEFVTHFICGNSTDGYSTYDSRDIDNDSFCVASQVYRFGEELEAIKNELK